MKGKITQLWNNRTSIIEGIKNTMFKNEHIEQIAAERKAICDVCPFQDKEGDSCLVPGTQPCCGKCGCSLTFKTRSLSSGCGDEENPRWSALLTEEEEDNLIEKLNSDI